MSAPAERFGRYELRGELGRGGFAIVFRAWDPTLGREVALKVLLPHLAADPSVHHRFMSEARAIARLHHPNIVTVYEVDESEGRPFFTMELVVGPTLASMIGSGKGLPLLQVAQVMRGLASAVDYLHSRWLVHRDIKASNVMLDTWDRVVLMDFGVARVLDETQVTGSGVSIGTPEAMSPEQVLGEQVGPPADIYALGVLSYRLLAGRPPFVGDPIHVIHSHVYDAAPPLAQFRAGLPQSAYAAVDSALAKLPGDRPALAHALAASLLAAAAEQGPEEAATAAEEAAAEEPYASRATFLPTPPKIVRPSSTPPAEQPERVTPAPLVEEQSSHRSEQDPSPAATVAQATPRTSSLPVVPEGQQRHPPAAPPAEASRQPAQRRPGPPPAARNGPPWKLIGAAAGALVVLVAVGVGLLATRGGGHPNNRASATVASGPPAVATEAAISGPAAAISVTATPGAQATATPAGTGTPTGTAVATVLPAPAAVTVLTGTGTPGIRDGAADQAEFNGPKGVAVGQDFAYVADTENSRIRRIGTDHNVTTLAGPGPGVASAAGYADQQGAGARFNKPRGIAVDKDGILFVADTDNNRIRRIDANGSVSTFAGSGGTGVGSGGFADGAGAQARFNLPTGLAFAGNKLYVADQRNNRIRVIERDGVVSTLAGASESGRVDGQGAAARFNNPSSIAVGRAGNIFVADTFNGLIRKITPEGEVSTYAGGGSPNTMEGAARSVAFVFPEGIAVDSAGTVYVADQTHTIRKIMPDGKVLIVAGGKEGFANNAGAQAQFDFPSGLILDGDGTLYVADTSNHRIRVITLK